MRSSARCSTAAAGRLELLEPIAEPVLLDVRVDGGERLLPQQRRRGVGEQQHAGDDQRGREPQRQRRGLIAAAPTPCRRATRGRRSSAGPRVRSGSGSARRRSGAAPAARPEARPGRRPARGDHARRRSRLPAAARAATTGELRAGRARAPARSGGEQQRAGATTTRRQPRAPRRRVGGAAANSHRCAAGSSSAAAYGFAIQTSAATTHNSARRGPEPPAAGLPRPSEPRDDQRPNAERADREHDAAEPRRPPRRPARTPGGHRGGREVEAPTRPSARSHSQPAERAARRRRASPAQGRRRGGGGARGRTRRARPGTRAAAACRPAAGPPTRAAPCARDDPSGHRRSRASGRALEVGRPASSSAVTVAQRGAAERLQPLARDRPRRRRGRARRWPTAAPRARPVRDGPAR